MPDEPQLPPKQIVFRDRRTGIEFVVDVPASSPWHELLPQVQEVDRVQPATWTPRR